MILVLNILSIAKGSWLVVKNKQIIFSHDFKISRGEDKSLLELNKLLKDNKLKLENFSGFILLVKDASMTQVKIFTTTVNTLAWQFNWPILAEYYFKEESNKVLDKLLNKLSKVKKFKAVSPKYSRQAEITKSKKKVNYTIVK